MNDVSQEQPYIVLPPLFAFRHEYVILQPHALVTPKYETYHAPANTDK